MKVPIFDLKYSQEDIENIFCNIRIVLKTGFVGEGQMTNSFERRFAEFQQVRHAIAVTSGTAALECALKAAEVYGDVLVPSNTFFATANAVFNVGANAVLGDCDLDSYALTPEAVLEFSTRERAQGVIIVHLGGHITPHIQEIVKICQERGLVLIEDCAHAHGAMAGSIPAGSFGQYGCFSLFPTKTMTVGEGGFVVTNSDIAADAVRRVKNFWRVPDDIGTCTGRNGSNYKISDITASVGVVEVHNRAVPRLRRRRDIHYLYGELLENDERFKVKFLDDPGYGAYKTIVEIDPSETDREELYGYCKDKGISLTGEVYRKPVHMQPGFYACDRLDTSFANTEKIARGHICPPNYPELTDSQVEYVCETLKSY